jgi:hypothetical protein
MLPALKTLPAEFPSARAALDHLGSRVVQRATVPLSDLRLNPEGRLSHVGPLPIEVLQAVPVADVALRHLNSLVGIPSGYAHRIDAELHAKSFNRLAAERLASVIVVVERDIDDDGSPRALAVVRGASLGIDDELVLRHLDRIGARVGVTFDVGSMDVQVGDMGTFEVLPADAMSICGLIRNAHWSRKQPIARPSLDVSVFALRLICSNGAVLQRKLANGRLMSWGTHASIEEHLTRELARVLEFPTALLKRAAAAMRDTMPTEREHEDVGACIARHSSPDRARELLKTATSWWDHHNAVTAAGRAVRSPESRLALQIAGGEIFDGFIGQTRDRGVDRGPSSQRLRWVR